MRKYRHGFIRGYISLEIMAKESDVETKPLKIFCELVSGYPGRGVKPLGRDVIKAVEKSFSWVIQGDLACSRMRSCESRAET